MRGVIFLGAMAMLSGFYLTWIEPPFAGEHLSPGSLLGAEWERFLRDAPWQVWVFYAGFLLAALAGWQAATGRGARAGAGAAVLAGLTPLVVVVSLGMRAEEIRADLGIPLRIDPADLGQGWRLLEDFVRLGLWAYLGGAILLLVAGIGGLLARRR